MLFYIKILKMLGLNIHWHR